MKIEKRNIMKCDQLKRYALKQTVSKTNFVLKNSGFTLLELFIVLMLGLVLFAGVMSVFVGLRATSAETSSYGEMQENGRFAISILTNDLLRQGFWGTLPVEMDNALLAAAPPVANNDCVGGGLNNGSFPQVIGHFRTIWGKLATGASELGCITDAKPQSDIIQVKRVIANSLGAIPQPVTVPVIAPLTMGDLKNNRYYLMSSVNSAQIFAGNAAVLPNILNSQVWEYQHHVFYVREETQGGNVVPVLMQARLVNAAQSMDIVPLVDGIENIRFWYGVDTDTDVDTNDYSDNVTPTTGAGDGVIDMFIPARSMTQALWDNNGSRILAVRMFVLVRDILPDNKYTNNNTYQLGGTTAVDQVAGGGDHYRRLLFSSTVSLQNSKVKVWN